MAQNTEQIIKAVKTLRNHGLSNGGSLGYHAGWCDEVADQVENALALIKEQQAEIERVRAEGKWLNAYEYAIKLGETNKYRLGIAENDKIWHFCSLCEQQVRFKRNYCPNCGAKMKGE